MFKLNKFLIQKKYNKNEKELIINDYKEGIKIDSDDKRVYNMKNNKLNGEYQQWYENGRLRTKCYCNSDRINGKYLTWYDNGQLYEKYYYKNDESTGEYLRWYKNDQLWIKKYYYKNNERNGEFLHWHENGKLIRKYYYKNGTKLYKNIKNHKSQPNQI